MTGKKTPHRLCAEITHWASGGIVQWWSDDEQGWVDCNKHTPPDWNSKITYRIKPKPSERSYPKSSLTYSELCNIWNDAHKVKTNEGVATVALRMCADAAVRRYIQDVEESSQ